VLLSPEKSSRLPLNHWVKVSDKRHPWARKETLDQMRDWIREAENADKLVAAGEKVMPLLLSGESRCGKTSTLCWLAHSYFDVPAFRASIGSMRASYMGQTTRNFAAMLAEAKGGPPGLYIMDEADGLFQQRQSSETGAASQEMNSALATALALIEDLPQHLMLVATTNEPRILDRAMLARFTHIPFPAWSELEEQERRGFAKSHGFEDAWNARSYAEAVQLARRARVMKILGT
jgi:SpoVK/Ycf46/Vps4 family AAA+-type ATPase